jgi:hypothetical protein
MVKRLSAKKTKKKVVKKASKKRSSGTSGTGPRRK